MKSVIVSLYAATPHLETELELAADLLAEGHAVHVLRCTGQLVSCMLNPEHRPGLCAVCVSKVDRGLARIASPRLTVETIAPSAPDPRLDVVLPDTRALRDFAIGGVNLGRGACATVCANTNKDIGLDARKHAEAIRLQLRAAHQVYTSVLRVLERERPERVYLFNGRFATMFPVVLAARKLGIDFYTHERGATTAHYMLRKNRFPHDLDVAHDEIVTLWGAGGPEKERIGRAWFEGRRRGVEDAWLSFTKAQQVGLLPEGFDPAQHNVAIFNSTMEEYYTIEGRPDRVYADENEGLVRVVDALAQRADVRLWLRVHPNMRDIPHQDNLQLRAIEALALRTPNLTVIWPESPVHTYELMAQAKVVLTWGSTMGVESAFWQKPCVLAGRAFYEQLDCVYIPSTHEEVLDLVTAPALAPKGGLGPIMYGYWEAMKGIRYRRFQPTGLFSGTFEGRSIEPSAVAKATSAAWTVLGR